MVLDFVEKLLLAQSCRNHEVLKELADDDCFLIRDQVAVNKNTTADILEKLNDDCESIRASVASNSNINYETFVKLIDDKSELVREAALKNFKNRSV